MGWIDLAVVSISIVLFGGSVWLLMQSVQKIDYQKAELESLRKRHTETQIELVGFRKRAGELEIKVENYRKALEAIRDHENILLDIPAEVRKELNQNCGSIMETINKLFLLAEKNGYPASIATKALGDE